MPFFIGTMYYILQIRQGDDCVNDFTVTLPPNSSVAKLKIPYLYPMKKKYVVFISYGLNVPRWSEAGATSSSFARASRDRIPILTEGKVTLQEHSAILDSNVCSIVTEKRKPGDVARLHR
ncbi:hypothetical protein KC351_g122 [Hortaea werneckii]|nr:hypothetical protein KC351_g122 [Hortaea werneckii]